MIDKTSDRVAVEVDVSPFYPQGGGQPSDTGFIEAPHGRLVVLEVSRTSEGIALHHGRVVDGRLEIGDLAVPLSISRSGDGARLHTAGGVICDATAELGRRWPVTAASHVPGQSRVAFATDLTGEEVPGFMDELKRRFAARAQRSACLLDLLHEDRARVGELAEAVDALVATDTAAVDPAERQSTFDIVHQHVVDGDTA